MKKQVYALMTVQIILILLGVNSILQNDIISGVLIITLNIFFFMINLKTLKNLRK